MIKDCHISQILNGITVNRKFAQTNLLGQSDEQRISEVLASIKKNGYPHDGKYIVLYNNELKIRDGRHRASCLLHIFGNIKIPVLRLYLKHGETDIVIPESGKKVLSNVIRCLCEIKLKNIYIAIKGGGIHTVMLLKTMGDDFDIRAIIDRQNKGQFSFPYEIIQDEEVAKHEVDTVVISSYIHRGEMKEDIKGLAKGYDIFDVYDHLTEMGFDIEKEFYMYDDCDIEFIKRG
jgi:hypothetical protein